MITINLAKDTLFNSCFYTARVTPPQAPQLLYYKSRFNHIPLL